MVRLSDQERAAVDAAARADGLAAGAWLGELAVREAAAPGRAAWAWGLSRADVVGVLVRVRLDLSLVVRLIDCGDDGAVQAAGLSRAALARLDALIDRAVADGDAVAGAADGSTTEPAARRSGDLGCDPDRDGPLA
jgi:hypothetical protein